MNADPTILAAADRNFIGAYLKLVEHVPDGASERFGAATAFVTGLPIALFNGCIVPASIAADELDRAVGWLRARELPHRFWIREDVAGDTPTALEERGYEGRGWPMPVMAMRPIVQPPPPAPDVAVRAVEDDAAYEELIAHQVDGGMPEELARAAYPRSIVADTDVAIFTAYLAGRPAGSAMAIRTGDVAGVYAVGTSPDARRRGVGTAATWAAAAAGRDWGCSMVVLQSSEMGVSVYAAMGFTELIRYVMFDRQ